jgi:glutamine synthetase
VLCSHFGRDGVPLCESPDTIVRAAYERAKQVAGVDIHALAEVEFFLGRRPQGGDIYGAADRGYHAVSPFVFGESMRRRAMTLLAELGVPIKYSHSEVGYIEADEMSEAIWEQHEIELALQPLPQAADAPMLTAWVLRNLAHQAGMRCSFDPVLREGHAGSGLHFHFSPVVDGEHRQVLTTDGEIAAESRWLVGGLAQYGGALMAFGNCRAGSFVRLSQAKEAPNTVTWGRFNRKCLIRIPVVPLAADGRAVAPATVEFRLPDGSAHPHILLAAVAQAMVAGRELDDLDELLRRTRTEVGAAEAADATLVPRSFAEVADQFEEHRATFERGGVFPAHVVDRLLDGLRTGRWLK